MSKNLVTPNNSAGLDHLIRNRRSFEKFYKVSTENMTLKFFKDAPIRDCMIALGFLDRGVRPIVKKDFVYYRSRVFNAKKFDVKRALFGNGPYVLNGCYVGLGKPNKGLMFIDITDELLKGYEKQGACFLSKARCEFDLVSPRIRRCKFCGRKQKGKLVISKYVKWEDADAVTCEQGLK